MIQRTPRGDNITVALNVLTLHRHFVSPEDNSSFNFENTKFS